MKLKEIFYLLGIRPRIRHYGHRIDRFELAGGQVEFANWEHPSEIPKRITQDQIDALAQYLRPGETAIDIGAHVGDTAVPMALAAGPGGCVFAFEPNSSTFEVLEVNASLNPGKGRIFPLPYAAAEAPGKLVFSYSDPGLCNGGELRGLSRWRHAHAFDIEVEAVHAESLLREGHPDEIARLRFVKVDSEGADLRVLKSIEGLLREFSPFIRCEVYRHLDEAQRKELFGFLLDLGYSLHEFESPENYRGRPLGLDDVNHKAHYDIFAIPATVQDRD